MSININILTSFPYFGVKLICVCLMFAYRKKSKGTYYTHPHKKGPVMKNYTRHLTSFSMVIYQAEHNLWCPVNVGWENFAQLQKFQVK